MAEPSRRFELVPLAIEVHYGWLTSSKVIRPSLRPPISMSKYTRLRPDQKPVSCESNRIESNQRSQNLAFLFGSHGGGRLREGFVLMCFASRIFQSWDNGSTNSEIGFELLLCAGSESVKRIEHRRSALVT